MPFMRWWRVEEAYSALDGERIRDGKGTGSSWCECG